MSKKIVISSDQSQAVAELGELEDVVERAAERVFAKLNATGATPVQRRYLRTKSAAQFLTLDEGTLIKMRCQGEGPAYRKLGNRCVYEVADLVAWVEGRFPKLTPAERVS